MENMMARTFKSQLTILTYIWLFLSCVFPGDFSQLKLFLTIILLARSICLGIKKRCLLQFLKGNFNSHFNHGINFSLWF